MSDQRFTMNDLGEAFANEIADAQEMGRRLQAAIDESAMSLPAASTGFDAATEARGGLADRVMAALEDEPAPAPAGFLLPLRRRGYLRGLGASIRQAWVGLGGSGRPLLARGAALAYVLVVAIAGVSLTGAATIGAAGALGLLGEATQSPVPTLPAPSPTPPTAEPSAPPSNPPSVSPSPSPSPSESPEESDDDGGSGAEPSDDHGGDSGSDGSDDDSGPESSGSDSDSDDSSDSGSSTPKPTQTPEPPETQH